MSSVTVIDHPLIKHKLTLMRKRGTSSCSFRTLLREVSMLMAYEVTRDLKLEPVTIETPLEEMDAPMLAGKKLVLIGILRAGVGILDGMLHILPAARVGHIGLYRDADSLEAIEYYFKVPRDLQDRDVFLVDPMLATGHTAVAAIERVRACNPRSIKFVALLSAPEGIAHLHEHHPDVPIFTAAVDRELNDRGYILPGLGDAGDRIFGTR